MIAALRLRALLGALLLFGSEVLLWTNPSGRSALEWLLLAVGYLALATLLLDLAARYRVEDLFGVLMLTGIYALLASVLLNPAALLNDLPRTLFTRVMGAHALLALEMVGAWLALGRGPQSRVWLWLGAGMVGLAWGVWAGSWPQQQGFPPVTQEAFIAWGVGGLALIAVLLYTPIASPAQPEALLLGPRSALALAAVAAGLLAWQFSRGALEIGALVLALLLALLCWAVLWYRHRGRAAPLLARWLPYRPLPLPAFLLAGGLLLGTGFAGFNLPPVSLAGVTPAAFIGLGFTAYGLVWLPGVSLVLGVQGYLRQAATRKL